MSDHKMIAQALRDAAKSLTPDNWCRGSYFTVKDGNVRMCAHGAVQAQVNSQVKLALAARVTDAARAADAAARADAAEVALAARVATEAVIAAGESAEVAGDAARAAAHAADAGARADSARSSALMAFGRRPPWVKDSLGGLDAHYIMGIAGLTASFNDNVGTSLDDVLLKLEEAAVLAEELCA